MHAHVRAASDPLRLVGLTALMDLTIGTPQIAIGLIDGPVATGLPQFAGRPIRGLSRDDAGSCLRTSSAACTHGTFVAGILSAARNSVAPAICPGCTLVTRPIFAETAADGMPTSTPADLARAIVEAVDAGVRVLNISTALTQRSTRGEMRLIEALGYAIARGVIAVAAAGNQADVGSSGLTGHPAVIAVVGCDHEGTPTEESNLGRSIGQRGLRAPGKNVISLGPEGQALALSGTSAAAPFVTGTIALLWSEFPWASATQIRQAVVCARDRRRRTITPPLLDAWGAYQALQETERRGVH